MRFTRLELLHWDIQANQVIVLKPGVNLLTGENGSGKTSILDAIKVVLGGSRIGGDRSVDDYLATQAAPYAMIRLIADNRPHPDTRRRPFDLVQPSEQDLATLAVVFEAGEEGYDARWYFCPGDVSPLVPGFKGRAFTRKSDYTSRLEKLGMGRSFRKLLCTPQGQIAALCNLDPNAIFDLLFDFIGGRQVLDEWESLRRDFDRQQRARDERKGALAARETELAHLSDRLRNHDRYRSHLLKMHDAQAALPFARHREAHERVHALHSKAERLKALEAHGIQLASQTHATLQRLRAAEAEASQAVRALNTTARELTARHHTLITAHAEAQARHQQLDALRRAAEPLPVRDLAALHAQRQQSEDAQADLRHQQRANTEATDALRAEQQRLEEGLLTPPDGVDAFRAVLHTHSVPHQLLLDLIEPLAPDPTTRRALESYLGDFRFAVAVPDLRSFVRATALARTHQFPFYVLAPDVRSPMPSTGAHPFLDQVRVQDPKYRGLVTRILRGVRWLDGPVHATLRERGAVHVDAEGFVLDRKGGRWQGTDRFYLGRDALQRRRLELEALRTERAATQARLQHERATLARQHQALQQAIREEEQRLDWHTHQAEHRHLTERLAALSQQIEALAQQHAQHETARQAAMDRRVTLRGQAAEHTERHRRAEADAASHRLELDGLHPQQQAADRALAAAQALRPSHAADEIHALAAAHSAAFLEQTIEAEHANVAHFNDAERDPNLPGNVITLRTQVTAVRGELERLDAQVDQAKETADRAYEHYKTATRRVFRRYFAQLKHAGEALGFTLEGRLRPRDDARFAFDLQVAAGEKALVPYRSPSLSGGQRAALSMLLAMTTLQVHHTDGGAGFFLIDEPFSASDTHKIQELGTFLAKTGAQYIVSMPTTEELRRCGAWLEAVLTCTQTPGGSHPDGRLRLAPPVKCSYVAHD
jgi:chromosome segregation ATPase